MYLRLCDLFQIIHNRMLKTFKKKDNKNKNHGNFDFGSKLELVGSQLLVNFRLFKMRKTYPQTS